MRGEENIIGKTEKKYVNDKKNIIIMQDVLIIFFNIYFINIICYNQNIDETEMIDFGKYCVKNRYYTSKG